MSLVRGTLAQPSVKYGRNNVCSQHFWCSTQGCAACRCGYLPSPSRLSPPPLLRVLCSPTCGTSDGSRSIDGRKFERFKKWPLRFGFFLSRGIWKRRSRITRITETDPPFRGDCYCDRRNDDTRRIIFTFYIDDTMKFDIEIFVLHRLIIFRREDTRRYKSWFVNFIKIDLFYI